MSSPHAMSVQLTEVRRLYVIAHDPFQYATPGHRDSVRRTARSPGPQSLGTCREPSPRESVSPAGVVLRFGSAGLLAGEASTCESASRPEDTPTREPRPLTGTGTVQAAGEG
jgi:hypothetical protein